MKTSGNTILLTGGGSGIGRELAQRWHDAGNVVIVTGRTLASLEETAKGRANIHAAALDVTDEGAIRTFVQDVLAKFPALNVLVNNAGIMPLEDVSAPRDLAVAEACVVTNLLGPIRLTDALVEHLSAQPDAAIVNVSSGLAFVPLVRAAVYSATKAAIHSWSDSLRLALAGKVEVIELAPPAVQTELTPGQSTREGYMPLGDFIDEVMSLFAQEPTPGLIGVQRLAFLRNAEAEGRYAETFATLNAPQN
ncbi:putative oxidoreductase [Novosphingobium sp. PhB165]|uniref:SDR family oxidoreductase n=1 Tax=Novosphingobium sp. PhB165 TaxID=2485105 RepID=UPI00104ED271|nr:SDR family oxidoreductase [Novosphingobium sp. PhB165]TCM19484.1 putative oxidoreductase [Novosphingobium sp. PhB165]